MQCDPLEPAPAGRLQRQGGFFDLDAEPTSEGVALKPDDLRGRREPIVIDGALGRAAPNRQRRLHPTLHHGAVSESSPPQRGNLVCGIRKTVGVG